MQLSNSLTPRSVSSSNYLLRQYGGAAAAYSLQRLDTSVENVVRARRSTDDAEADFTAQEVSGGSLREFALNNDSDLVRFADQAVAADERMYFDGVNDRVDTGYKADATSDFFVEATFIMDELVANQSILADAGSERLVQLLINASGQLQANVLSSAGIQVVATGSTTLVVGQAYTVRLTHDVSASRMTIDLDGVQDGTGTYTGTFNAANYNAITVGAFPSGILLFNGLIYDVNFNNESSYQGYGNTNADWEDQVGSDDGIVVGSPALFSGQGFDAYVTTLYDQSGALGQPLSRFAQHATAADTRMQFDGSDDYVSLPFDTSSCTNATITIYDVTIQDDTGILLVNGGSGSPFVMCYQSGSTNSSSSTSGSPTTYVDDVAIGSTRDNLYVALSDGLPHKVEVRGTDLTGWGNIPRLGWYFLSPFQVTGIIGRVSVDYTGDGTLDADYLGTGNTNADWEDQVGSNDGTVNGSPSIYEGRNALQATAASQPQIVADGVVVTDGSGNWCVDFNGSNHFLNLPNNSMGAGTAPMMAFAFYKNDNLSSRHSIFSAGDNASATDAMVVQSPNAGLVNTEIGICFTGRNPSSASTDWECILMGNTTLGFYAENGGTVTSFTLNNSISKSGLYCGIGATIEPAGNYFDGKLHSFFIYHETPTTQRFSDIYNAVKSGIGSGLGLP